MPDFDYLLVDTKRLDDGLLRELNSEIACFLLLDNTEFADARRTAERIVDIFIQMVKKLHPEVQDLLGRYILGLAAHRGYSDLRDDNQLIPWLYSKKGVGMLAQSFERALEERRREGRQEGLQEGLMATAQRMLGRGFSRAQVVDLTGLSDSDVRTLEEKPQGSQ